MPDSRGIALPWADNVAGFARGGFIFGVFCKDDRSSTTKERLIAAQAGLDYLTQPAASAPAQSARPLSAASADIAIWL
jgi:hypothetical protein